MRTPFLRVGLHKIRVERSVVPCLSGTSPQVLKRQKWRSYVGVGPIQKDALLR